ncbi:MAG: FAD-dependent oxidoreductase [Methyloceanibacter sp.]
MQTGRNAPGPLHVAVVGSGPSGFYAAEALLRSEADVRISMIERLPTPYGLVRSGVAPDHPNLKQPMIVYDRIARTEGFSFLGNVMIGRDVTVDELLATHHAVVMACGAQVDKRMGIPGEDLRGSHTATEFVGWYNGHPDHRDRTFDLSQEVAVIVGQGNVAADVCRILAKPVDELRQSDISAHAIEVLAESKIREFYVVGRRGPAQAKFTSKELRELGSVTDCVAVANADECILSEQCEKELAERSNMNATKNMELFRRFADQIASDARRRITFRFFASPKELVGQERVEKIVLTRNRLEGIAFSQVARPSGETEEIDCGLVFRSIGYRGVPIFGLPFDEDRSVLPNKVGRILEGDRPLPGLYVTGWLKRGPSGIIGTNRADSMETVENLLADFPSLTADPKPGVGGLQQLLEERGVRSVNLSDWINIDSAEVERGKKEGKPREKFTRIDDMLDVLADITCPVRV